MINIQKLLQIVKIVEEETVADLFLLSSNLRFLLHV